MKNTLYRDRVTVGFRLFRAYVKWFNNTLFFKKIYINGAENLPKKGEGALIVSNHQNSMIDPLQIIFACSPRLVHMYTRAGVFENKIAGKVMRWFGALPAYRLRTEGEEALTKNEESLDVGEDFIRAGQLVSIFAEGTHQDHHGLGEFSLGYTKIVFDCAQKDVYKKEVKVIPIALNYGNYFGIQNELEINIGEPISAQKYYDLHQNKPRTAQRKLNQEVRESIQSRMLDITDLPHYGAIDYLRKNYGDKYCADRGIKGNYLPDRVKAEKQLVAELEAIGEKNENSLLRLYDRAQCVREMENRTRTNDLDYALKTGKGSLTKDILLLIFGLPLFVASLWPYAFIYLFPQKIVDKAPDMFKSSILFGSSVLFTLPLTYLLSGIGLWRAIEAWVTPIQMIIIIFAYFLILPSLGIYAWNYKKKLRRSREKWRYCFKNKKETQLLKEMRAEVFAEADQLLNP